MKRIAVLQDLSCFGKCSMTVTLPVLSAVGFECVPLPVMLLSSHTAYPRPARLSLRDFSESAMLHWQALGLTFDAVLIGYLGSRDMIDFAAQFLARFSRTDTPVILDPAMADNGQLYGGLSPDFPVALRRLCQKAHIVLPNITEAALLAGDSAISPGIMAKSLAEQFSADIVVTGCETENRVDTLCCDYRSMHLETISNRRAAGRFHGTGDLFSAVFTAAILSGMPLAAGVAAAADFVEVCVRLTAQQNRDEREGLIFEPLLSGLPDRFGLQKVDE